MDSGFGKAVLIDFCIKRLTLALRFLQGVLLNLLFFMLSGLVLERVLVKYFVFTLTSIQPVSVAVIVLKLFKH